MACKVQYSIGAIQDTFSFELNSSVPVDGVTLKGRVDTFVAALQKSLGFALAIPMANARERDKSRMDGIIMRFID